MMPSTNLRDAPQARYRAAEQVVACDIESGLALLNVNTATYFTLNGVGGAVWALLSEPRTLADLVAGVTATYDVDPDVCRQDLVSLLAALQAAQLVEPQD